MGKVYAVGVGPGSPKYVTEIVKEIIKNCDIIIGYKYTLKTIEHLMKGKEIIEITGSSSKIVFKDLPKDDPKVRQPDISLAKKLLDWEPKVSRRDGLTKTLEYFKQQLHGVPQT